MVAFAPPDIIARPLDDVVGKTKVVPPDSDLLLTAKALGVTFGDEPALVADERAMSASAAGDQVEVFERAAGVEQDDRVVRL